MEAKTIGIIQISIGLILLLLGIINLSADGGVNPDALNSTEKSIDDGSNYWISSDSILFVLTGIGFIVSSLVNLKK
jgi:hypothetical protein